MSYQPKQQRLNNEVEGLNKDAAFRVLGLNCNITANVLTMAPNASMVLPGQLQNYRSRLA